jgi:creatinine amidohydrolase
MALAAALPVVAQRNRVGSPWAGSAGVAAVSRTERSSPRVAARLSAFTLGFSPAKEHPMKYWRLADITYGHVKSSAPFEVAVLPLGATEPHNLHLPYGTDTTQVEVIGDRACAIAVEQGARVVLLPAIPYGTETNQMNFPLAMNLNPTTLGRVITDLVESLAAHGVRKVLLLNGHGGNDLKWLLRELHRTTTVHLFLCNWYKVAADGYETIFEHKDDHAGEMETSMGLAHFPELVNLQAADPGSVRPSRFAAVNQGWIEMTRPWHLLTTNSGSGDPSAATAAKGEAITQRVCQRIGDFLAELSRSPIDDQFPF